MYSSVLYNQLRCTRNYILGSIISSSVENYTESRLFWPNFYKWNGILSQYHHIQSILLNWTTFLKSKTNSITFICGFMGKVQNPSGSMGIHADAQRSMRMHGDPCGSKDLLFPPWFLIKKQVNVYFRKIQSIIILVLVHKNLIEILENLIWSHIFPMQILCGIPFANAYNLRKLS